MIGWLAATALFSWPTALVALAVVLLAALLVRWRPARHPRPQRAAELAARVADLLERGEPILGDAHHHYNGMGLVHADGVFVYGKAHEHVVQLPGEVRFEDPGRREFAGRAAFVAWLAACLVDRGGPPDLPVARLERLVRQRPAA